MWISFTLICEKKAYKMLWKICARGFLIVSLTLGAIFLCYFFMGHDLIVDEMLIYSTNITLTPGRNHTERDVDTDGVAPNTAKHANSFTWFGGITGTKSVTGKPPQGINLNAVSASSDVLNRHADDRLVYNRIPKCGSTTAVWIMEILSKRNNFTLVKSEVYNHQDLTLKEEVGKKWIGRFNRNPRT